MGHESAMAWTMKTTQNDAGYEIIDPPNKLKSKVRMLVGRDAQMDPVERAEKAIERLSANFGDWMEDEVTRLIEQWRKTSDLDFSPEARAALYRVAHDMRGQAATLGFPSVGKIAGVFCDILDAFGDRPVPDTFLEKYIDAIRAIARETDRGEDNAIASELSSELERAGQELVEAMDKPESANEAA